MPETQETRKNEKLVNRITGFSKCWKSGSEHMVVRFANEKMRNPFRLCPGSSVDFFLLYYAVKLAATPQPSQSHVGKQSKLTYARETACNAVFFFKFCAATALKCHAHFFNARVPPVSGKDNLPATAQECHLRKTY